VELNMKTSAQPFVFEIKEKPELIADK
jgi:hypothetical protein